MSLRVKSAVLLSKNLVELYLDEPRIDVMMKLDILSFWRANNFQYPELARIAGDILSIPVSSMASDSTYSVGGEVLDQYRNALKPDVLKHKL